jgi:hypothetical protein
MPNREAISVLDEYELRQLDKELFRKPLHHLGDSFAGFYRFAQKVNSFKPMGCNELLLDRLKFILEKIRNDASSDPSTFETLIERSFREVPCSRYTSCKGHRYDPHCKHRK